MVLRIFTKWNGRGRHASSSTLIVGLRMRKRGKQFVSVKHSFFLPLQIKFAQLMPELPSLRVPKSSFSVNKGLMTALLTGTAANAVGNGVPNDVTMHCGSRFSQKFVGRRCRPSGNALTSSGCLGSGNECWGTRERFRWRQCGVLLQDQFPPHRSHRRQGWSSHVFVPCDGMSANNCGGAR